MKRQRLPEESAMPDTSTAGRRDLMQTLAHHDAAISTLGTQMKTLQGEVHSGFSTIANSIQQLSSRLEQVNARPTFDFQKAVSTVLSLAVLFSMVVGGIIWVTTNQFAGMVAEQKHVNSGTIEMTKKHDADIRHLMDKIGWAARVEAPKR